MLMFIVSLTIILTHTSVAAIAALLTLAAAAPQFDFLDGIFSIFRPI